MNKKWLVIVGSALSILIVGLIWWSISNSRTTGPQPSQLKHDTVDLAAIGAMSATLQTNSITDNNTIWAIGQGRLIGYDPTGAKATTSWALPTNWVDQKIEVVGARSGNVLLKNPASKIFGLVNVVKGSVDYLPDQTVAAQFVDDKQLVIYKTDADTDLPHLISYPVTGQSTQELWNLDHRAVINFYPTSAALFVSINNNLDTSNASLYRFNADKKSLDTVLSDIGYIYTVSPDGTIIYYNTFEGSVVVGGLSQPQNISHYRNLKTGEDRVIYPFVDLRYTAWQDNKLYTYSLQDGAYHPVALDKQNMTKIGTDQFSAVTAISVDKKPEVVVNTDTGVHQINL